MGEFAEGTAMNSSLEAGPLASRRELFRLIAATVPAARALAEPAPRVGAIAFDAFVLFDPRGLVERAREVAHGKAEALVAAASNKLFAYTWLRTSAGRYAPFDTVAREAFRYAAASEGIELTAEQLDHIVEGYSKLALWRDVPPALERLRRRGLRLAMLSNLSEAMLRANLIANGISQHFEFVLSTDRVRQFKPAPAAYQLAVKAFGRRPRQVGFAASASWDASGASWFGFPTVWVNRAGAQPEQLDVSPAILGSGMDAVLELARIA